MGSREASRSDLVEALGAVDLFAGLPADVLERIAAQTALVTVDAGEWLFRQGEDGDAVYSVISGRLEVLAEETGVPRVIGIVGRGAVFGEISLLTETARSASVRARRDSELARITREDFVTLLHSEPSVTLSLTRALGARTAKARPLVQQRPGPPATIALVPMHGGLPMEALADALADELRALAPLGRFGGLGENGAGPGRRLDELEREHGRVLLHAAEADPADPWTAFCVRQADRVVAVADVAHPVVAPGGRLRGCDLALTGGRPAAAVARWLDAVDPRALHLLDRGLAVTARRLAGRSVGVVLSGGGARGFAHIGVLEELVASGVRIDRVGGTSMGAFVGALFAMGHAPARIAELLRSELVDQRPLTDYTFPLVALTRGRRGWAMIRRLFGDQTIETLEREWFGVACDLVTNTLVEQRRGGLGAAVGAAVALPGFVPPVVSDGRILVDGGVLDNLPVEAMALRGEGPVIASDMTLPTRPRVERQWYQRRPRARRVVGRTHALVTGARETPLSFPEVLTRCVTLGSRDTVAAAGEHAALLIRPSLPEVQMLDWGAMDRAIAAGRQAARTALAGGFSA